MKERGGRMSKIVAEKFEVREPYEDSDDARGRGWVSDRSARKSKEPVETVGRHKLPPGMNIEDQDPRDMPRMGINTAGGLPTALAQGNRTHDINEKSLRQGFDRKKMRPTDDMYSNEHNDAFYGEATVDGVTGFIERNNMLDRY